MGIKYDKIGVDYSLTRRADNYLTERLLDNLNPDPDGIYLDIGCGTGNYTHEFNKRGHDFIGIDPSSEMLDKAKEKSNSVEWRIGSAEKTDLESESIDGIVGTLTIHHWTDLRQGFIELFRILKRKGRMVIFTSTPEQMKGYWLNYYFPKMLEESSRHMPSYQSVKQAMNGAGFAVIRTETYSIRPDLDDLFLYSGKHNPELYFKSEVRNGISSFSSLATRDEVNTGLAKLRVDMNSDKISEIIKSFENDLGDYLFITGEKASSQSQPQK